MMATSSLLAPPPARAAAPAAASHRRRRATPTLTVAVAQPSGKAAKPSSSRGGRPKSSSTASASSAPTAAPVAPPAADDPPLEDLKLMLLDSLYGVDRGLNASSEVRAEINELITQLEARCPPLGDDGGGGGGGDDAPPPPGLEGAWTLAYTANSELVPLLALGRLPGCAVGPITQTIGGGTVRNAVPVSGPLAATILEATATVQARSPRRLALRFERGRVAPPTSPAASGGASGGGGFAGLLPSRLSLLGTDVDLAPLKAALAPADDAARAAAAALASAAAGLPPLDFPIGGGPLGSTLAETWLLTTFLDGDLRIARGDGGSVFVMTRAPEEVAAAAAAAAANAQTRFEDMEDE